MPGDLHVFQWHHYGADLPVGAERMASSALYPNQVVPFDKDRLSFQEHPEQLLAGKAHLRRMDSGGPLRPGGLRAQKQADLARHHSARMNVSFGGVFALWIDAALTSANGTVLSG